MNRTYTYFILVVWMLLAQNVMAQERSAQQVLSTAAEFLQSKVGKTGDLQLVDVPSAQTVQGSRRAPAVTGGYHVVNDKETGTFVIVSADERMTPILGWSDRGAFDADQMPPGLVDLLERYARQYAYLQLHGGSPAKAPKVTVSSLIKTKWGQRYPFNEQCPVDTREGYENERCITGCVATAMAQLMYYHQYGTPTGTVTYTAPRLNQELTLDMSSITFDWAKMKTKYSAYDTYPDADVKAISDLMYACGVSLHMDYGSDVSSAYSNDIVYALRNNFGYPETAHHYMRQYYKASEWEQMIQDELKANRPIIYSGHSEKSGGHEFIIDGCNSNGYTVNWGWYGQMDGTFMLDAMAPHDELNDMDFTEGQGMTIGIQTSGTAERLHTWYAGRLWLGINNGDTSVGNSINAGFSDGFCCYCTDANSYKDCTDEKMCKIYYGVALYDQNFQFIKTLSANTVDLNSDWSYSWINTNYFSLDAATFTEGSTYYMAGYTKGYEDGKMGRIRTTNGRTDFIKITVKDGLVYKSIIYTPNPRAEGAGTMETPYNCAGAFNVAAALDDSDYSEEVYISGIVGSRTSNDEFMLCDDGDVEGDRVMVKYCMPKGDVTSWTKLDQDVAVGDELVIRARLNYDSSAGEVKAASNVQIVSQNGNTEPAKGKTADDPISVAALLPIVRSLSTTNSTTTGEYVNAYVKGYVSNVKEINTNFGNATFYIKDTNDGSTTEDFYIYRVKGLNNQKIADANLIKVGDLVVVWGKCINYNGSTPEISNTGYIYSITDTSGIRDVTVDPNTDGVWYDLYGHRLQSKPDKPGLYIVNGQKVLR